MRFLIPRIVGFTVAFRILMEIIYVNLLHDLDALTYRLDIDYTSYFFSWMVFLLFSIIISKEYKNKGDLKASNIILILLFYMSYIPTSIYFCFAGLTYDYFSIFTYYWALIFIFKYLFESNKFVIKNQQRIELSKNTRKILYTFIIIFASILILATSFKLYGTIYLHFGLVDVYDLRSNASEIDAGTLYSLLLTWAGIIFIPISAVSCFQERKYLKFAILVFIQIVSFSIAGHKMQLFIIPVGLITFKILKMDKIFYLPHCFVGLGIITLIEEIYLESDIIFNFIVRRVFFIPALLNAYYIDYFANQYKLWFIEDMLLGRMQINLFGVSRTYNSAASQLIGFNYFGSSEMLANNGMFAYGYADAGIIGVTLAAFSLVAILYLLNWISKDLDIGYSGIIVIIFTVALISVSTSTILYSYLIPLLMYKFLKESKAIPVNTIKN